MKVLMRAMNDFKKYQYQAMKDSVKACSSSVCYDCLGVTTLLVGELRVCLCYKCACGRVTSV